MACLGRVGDAAVIRHRILHGNRNMLPLAGLFTLVKRREQANRAMQTGPGIAKRRAGFERTAIGFAGDAHHPAGGLADHIEAEKVLVGTAFAVPLDLGVDDCRIERFHLRIRKAEPLNYTRCEVFNKNISFGN